MSTKNPKSEKESDERPAWIVKGYDDFFHFVMWPHGRAAKKKRGELDGSIRKIDQLTPEDQERILLILDYELKINFRSAIEFTPENGPVILEFECLKGRYLSKYRNKSQESDILAEVKRAVRESIDLCPMHLWRCFNCERYFVLPYIRSKGRIQKSCSRSCQHKLLRKLSPEFKKRKRELKREWRKREKRKDEKALEKTLQSMGRQVKWRPCLMCGVEFENFDVRNQHFCSDCLERRRKSRMDYHFFDRTKDHTSSEIPMDYELKE